MARAARRRRRKRRGTQAGTIGRGPSGRPRSRAEARARARSRARAPRGGQRRQREPSWRGAINRGLIAAGIFLVLLAFLFRRPIAEAIYLSAFMLLIYIPMGHYMDRFFYGLRQRREAKMREKHTEEHR